MGLIWHYFNWLSWVYDWDNVPLNVHHFYPKGKSLSCSGHLNLIVLRQVPEVWYSKGCVLKVKKHTVVVTASVCLIYCSQTVYDCNDGTLLWDACFDFDSFLFLLPQHLHSTSDPEELGYEQYVQDADRQYQACIARCACYAWPNEATFPEPAEYDDTGSSDSRPEADHGYQFYEGPFLRMLFTRLVRLPYQVRRLSWITWVNVSGTVETGLLSCLLYIIRKKQAYEDVCVRVRASMGAYEHATTSPYKQPLNEPVDGFNHNLV